MSKKIDHVSREDIQVNTYVNSKEQISYGLSISYRDRKGKYQVDSILITQEKLPIVMSLLQKSAIAPHKALHGFYSSKESLNKKQKVIA